MSARSDDDEIGSLVGHYRAVASPLRAFLKDLHGKYRDVSEGKLADYIPELAKADPNWFGISVATVDGQIFDFGNFDQQFTIQSISKPFVYSLALEDHGRDRVMSRIGVEPSGDSFNSIILEAGTRRPHNPMVNAGAIAAASLIEGSGPAERLNHMLKMFQRFVGHEVAVDMAVFTSERATGHRNRAIAYLMLNFGMMPTDVEDCLDLYFKQCSLLVTSRDLAVMAATLANKGVNPITHEPAMSPKYVRDVLSLMLSCGMYDFAGEWAYRVGLPAKSGVGGGIIAVVPGRAGIGVFSPLLDERGNSVRGIRACTELSEHFGLHIFDCHSAQDAFGAALNPRPSRPPTDTGAGDGG